MIGGFLLKPSDAMVYENSEEEISTPEVVEPSVPQEWLDEAEKAKEDVLKRKALEAESSDLENQINQLKERKAEVDKELGTY